MIRGRREVRATALLCDDTHVARRDPVTDLGRDGCGKARKARVSLGSGLYAGQSWRTFVSRSLRSNGFAITSEIFRSLNWPS